jgi:hypothetical protein
MSNSNNIPIKWDHEQDNNLLGNLFPGGLQNKTLQKTSDNNEYQKLSKNLKKQFLMTQR